MGLTGLERAGRGDS